MNAKFLNKEIFQRARVKRQSRLSTSIILQIRCSGIIILQFFVLSIFHLFAYLMANQIVLTVTVVNLVWYVQFVDSVGSSPQKYPQQSMGETWVVVGGLLGVLKIVKNLTKLVKSCEKSIENRHSLTSSKGFRGQKIRKKSRGVKLCTNPHFTPFAPICQYITPRTRQ